MAIPDRSCSGSNPATPPPVEVPRSIALIPETPESSRAVLTDLTPATPARSGARWRAAPADMPWHSNRVPRDPENLNTCILKSTRIHRGLERPVSAGVGRK